MTGSIVAKTLSRLALFAVVHSALASLPIKRRIAGSRKDPASGGAYRAVYTAGAVVSTAALIWSVWRLPDRPLYRVTGKARITMMLGQASGALGILAVAFEVGPAVFTGVGPALSSSAGRHPQSGPVAQHPLPASSDELGWGGPFRRCRHPNNAFPVILLACSPTMTVKWATFTLGTLVYMVLGSLHEEQRLRTAYGEAFERYRCEVPHLLLPLGRR